ncbi:hypothetical protein MHU86_4220 [Fragilaria crotonensis]|nr:hypothetical protein MHU86_4220 [Fragilaria crotonensis]
MVRLLTVLLVLLSQLSTSWGFHSVVGLQRYSLRLHAEDFPWESAFPDAQVLTIQMQEHRPLGCTVEESLADSDLKPVFVSKVVEGSFASQAGLKVGDVILAISGVFGGMNNVLGRGIDEVTSTVAGRPEGEALEFRIARGTQVLTQHESALVDLCANVGEDEKAIEECVLNFLTSAYSDDEGDEPGMDGSCGGDEETECLPRRHVRNFVG